MKSIFDKIKKAPIGATLRYNDVEGVVTEDPNADFECWDCIYGVDGDPCAIYDKEGKLRVPCWASEHVSGKLIIVKRK